MKHRWNLMGFLAAAVLAATGCTGGGDVGAGKAASGTGASRVAPTRLRIFFTGSVLGETEPCG